MLEPSELFPEIPNLYEFPSIHADMIFDDRRVSAYREAITRTIEPGDVVADVGTGTGILAFLCLKAGAARVHAIDRSPVIHWARKLAEANGLSDGLLFHNCDSRELRLDEKVDVIVSELIGHIAFEEGMVETISDAIDRFLRPGGAIIPETVTLNAAPVCETEVHKTCIDGWTEHWGIDYTVLGDYARTNCYVTEISEEELLAKPEPVFSVDFRKSSYVENRASQNFRIHRSGLLNGVAFWFDSLLTRDVRLSSGPWSNTHWKQGLKPLQTPVEVVQGDEIKIIVDMQLRNQDKAFEFEVLVQKGEHRAEKNEESSSQI